MKASRRHALFGTLFLLMAIGGAAAFNHALVPATHPDHDHGILNLDGGGKLIVWPRSREPRNLVGRPGHVFILHFISPSASGAAEELAALFEFQKRYATDKGVEVISILKSPDWTSLDAWLSQKHLAPPSPASVVLDPNGETTEKLNCKRPLETMFFTPEGKLSSQARGRLDWASDGAGYLERARGGTTLE